MPILSPQCQTEQPTIEQILEQLNWYILDQARKKVPRSLFLQGELDLEIEELAQSTRIKLWLALQKGHVVNPVGYARRITLTESVDMRRHHKEVTYLSILDDSETYYDKEMQDPYESIEREETSRMCIERITEAILELPPCQRQAMLHTLMQQYDDAFPAIIALKEQGIDIEAMCWPDEESDRQRRRASLSLARRKLRALLFHEQPEPVS